MKLIRQKYVTIRKEHACFGCLRKFQKGEEMLFTVSEDMGTLNNAYFCIDCDHYTTENDITDGICEGDLLYDAEYRTLIGAGC